MLFDVRCSSYAPDPIYLAIYRVSHHFYTLIYTFRVLIPLKSPLFFIYAYGPSAHLNLPKRELGIHTPEINFFKFFFKVK